MVHVDSSRCTGCGSCVDVCPQKAIIMHNELAMINEDLCIKCGTCAEVCPVGAIRELEPAYEKLSKGGDRMPYGYGRGFGFRGASPSWPYVGRGRGGLPRCWYPGLAMALPYPPAPSSYSPQMTQEAEIDWLKSQAEAIKSELNRVEARLRDLEAGKAEALRLKDLEDLDQEQCAQRMNISRATFQRVLEAARKKTSDALLNGKAIRIEGGNFEIAPFRFQCQNGHVWEAPYGFMAKELGQSCPVCNSTVVAPLQPLEPEQVAHGWGRCRRGRADR